MRIGNRRWYRLFSMDSLEGVRHPWLPVVDYGAVISSWRRCYVDLPPQTSTSGPYRPASRRDALAITSLLYIGCTVITNRCLTPSSYLLIPHCVVDNAATDQNDNNHNSY